MGRITAIYTDDIDSYSITHVVMLTGKPLEELHAEFKTHYRLAPRPDLIYHFGEWLIERNYAREATGKELVEWHEPNDSH